MNTQARFKIVDARRAMKAAQALGPEWQVDIKPDGTISLIRRKDKPATMPEDPIEEERLYVF